MEEKKRILDMLAEKKITSEEAMRLLTAVNAKPESEKKGARFLKITVFENDNVKPKVNVSIPIMLVKLGAKVIPKDKMMQTEIGNSKFDLSGIDWDEILKLASKGEIGDIFNADIEEDSGKMIKVRIYIE
jgi:hypothetical protein